MFEVSGLVATVVGAFMAAGLSGVGSAYGTHIVGSANATAMAEGEGEKFSNFIILQALPGTQGIYGFVILFMILMQSGITGGNLNISSDSGQVAFWAGTLMGVNGLFSAILQGRVAAMTVPVAVKYPEETMKAAMFSVIVELYALLALVGSLIIILNGVEKGTSTQEIITSFVNLFG
ncbi:MAG TPA: V-type ATP synthase subunit K [Thermoplasmata archaeon]|nr:V-type ATP synthase subunit K [Thermoplasmata archaeon]